MLGLTLERAAGKPYADLLRERILWPVGMKNTQLQTVESGDLVARGYNMFGLRAKPWHFRAYAPCGALVSTAADLVRFSSALADPAGPLAKAVELSTRPQKPVTGGSIGLAWLLPRNSEWVWHNGGTFGYQALLAFHMRVRSGIVLLANQYGNRRIVELGRKLMFDALPASAEERTPALS